MKSKTETFTSSSPAQFGLDYRTEAEVKESIRRKGGKNLDERESALVEKEMEEDRGETERLYRSQRH